MVGTSNKELYRNHSNIKDLLLLFFHKRFKYSLPAYFSIFFLFFLSFDSRIMVKSVDTTKIEPKYRITNVIVLPLKEAT